MPGYKADPTPRVEVIDPTSGRGAPHPTTEASAEGRRGEARPPPQKGSTEPRSPLNAEEEEEGVLFQREEARPPRTHTPRCHGPVPPTRSPPTPACCGSRPLPAARRCPRNAFVRRSPPSSSSLKPDSGIRFYFFISEHAASPPPPPTHTPPPWAAFC